MGARLCRMGMTWSSSAPSVTRMNASAGNVSRTASSCSLTFLSDSKLGLLCPVRVTTSRFSNSFLTSSNFLRVAKMALESVSPGSASASLAAALRQAFRPTTGPWTLAFLPRSSSRSTQTPLPLLYLGIPWFLAFLGRQAIIYIGEARILIYWPLPGRLRAFDVLCGMVLAETHGHSGYGGGHGSHGAPAGAGHGHGHGHKEGTRKPKEAVFVGVLLLLALVLFLALGNQNFLAQNLVPLVFAAFAVFMLWRFDFLLTLSDYERAVISRFGRVNRVGGPGWCLLLPPIETYETVELRTQIVDIPKQDVVTKDGIEVKIDAVIYLRVRDEPRSVINSVVKVEDYKRAAELYVVSEIRDVGGTLTMRELISNVDELNSRIQATLEKVAHGWGVEIQSVEIRDIDIPKAVLDAMHEEKAAVQKKLARMEEAEAHKAEIDAVKEAAEHLSDKAISYYYIKALEKMSEGKSTKIVFPMEISKLAAQISGKLGASVAAQPEAASAQSDEQLVARYAPLLAAALKKEASRRGRNGKKGKGKGNGKKKAKKKAGKQ